MMQKASIEIREVKKVSKAQTQSKINEVLTAPILGKHPLQMLPSLIEHVVFSSAEKKFVATSLEEKALDKKRSSYEYDINVLFSREEPIVNTLLPGDILQIRSRNLGYDFALLKTPISNASWWMPKQVVQIYIAKFGEDKYEFFQTVPNLAKAISFIDQIYCQSAELHLP